MEKDTGADLYDLSYAYGLIGKSKFDLKQWDSSIKYLSKSIKLEEGINIPFALRLRGICHKELGNKRDAIKDFNKAIELGDQDSSDHLELLLND